MTKINLVLAGGGIRFGAYIGALYALQESGIAIDKIVGISGGSIISSMYAAGYSLDVLKELMLEMDYEKFKDFGPLSLISGMGLYKGRRLEKWLDKQLVGRTFASPSKIEHYIVATDVLRGRPVIFSKKSFPDLKVSKAIRFSIGIPLFYTFKKFHVNKDEFGIMIDGNITSFSMEDMFFNDKYKTLTLRLATSKSDFGSFPGKFSRFTYVFKLVKLLMNSIERERIGGDRWRNTIIIFSGSIASTKFDLTKQEKLFLFEQGYNQVKENLKKTLLEK
ncbi:MAG: patatin-like phospholipase family protein [Nitrospirae bacterium]|nr:patatin-like phospholipase family protein [Nitrospirota bacterium]